MIELIFCYLSFTTYGNVFTPVTLAIAPVSFIYSV